MTDVHATLRPRRTSSGSIPPGVLAWFRGKAGVDAAGWLALLPTDEPRLLAMWAEYKAEHPRAKVPAGADWVAWP